MNPLKLANTAEQWTIKAMEVSANLKKASELNAACFQSPWTPERLVKEPARPELAHIFIYRSAQQRIVGYCAAKIVLD